MGYAVPWLSRKPEDSREETPKAAWRHPKPWVVILNFPDQLATKSAQAETSGFWSAEAQARVPPLSRARQPPRHSQHSENAVPRITKQTSLDFWFFFLFPFSISLCSHKSCLQVAGNTSVLSNRRITLQLSKYTGRETKFPKIKFEIQVYSFILENVTQKVVDLKLFVFCF